MPTLTSRSKGILPGGRDWFVRHGQKLVQHIDYAYVWGTPYDYHNNDGILSGGFPKRPGTIIHDTEAVKAHSTARPRGSWGRGWRETNRKPLGRLNRWLWCPKVVLGRLGYKGTDEEVPKTKQWVKRSVQTCTSEQSNSDPPFYWAVQTSSSTSRSRWGRGRSLQG